MSNTRSFKSLGIIAEDAQPVTEDGDRVQGEFYRRTNITDLQQAEGEEFDVPPRSEFVNGKLNNISSFTDLIDTRGFPGWTDLVDYEPPVIVWASDGNLYFCISENGPNSFIVDPIDDNQEAPIYWRIYEDPEQLRLDLSDETPGSEGSRLVGYNKFDINGGVDDGLTVKQALDQGYKNIFGMLNVEVLASGFFIIETTVTPPNVTPVLFNGKLSSHFNTSMNISQIEIIPWDNPSGDYQEARFQGVRIIFDNPVPTPYDVILSPRDIFVSSNIISRAAVSFKNPLADSIEVMFKRLFSLATARDDFELEFDLLCYRII